MSIRAFSAKGRIGSPANDWISPHYIVPTTGTGQIAWFSDWHTATGNSDNALTDGGKWDELTGSIATADWTTIISNPGTLGFPSNLANIYQVTLPASEFSRNLIMNGGRWTTPVIGEFVYFRVYHHNAFPNGHITAGYHPIQNGRTNLAWEWKFEDPAAGAITCTWYNSPLTANYPYTHYHMLAGAYTTGVCRRIEWRLERTGSTSMKIQIRIYNSVGTLVYTNADFYRQDSSTISLVADENLYTLNAVPNLDDSFQQITCGNNGPQLFGRTGSGTEYYGAMAARKSSSNNDWIGDYVPGLG